jgi:hypothetical protein
MKALLPLVLAVALALGLVACNGDGGGGDGDASPEASPTAAGSPGPGVCLPNPDPSTPDTAVVDTPAVDEEIAGPVIVRGKIKAERAVLKISIYDEDGSLLVDTQTTSVTPGFLSAFENTLPYSVLDPTPACLWVYEVAEDGETFFNITQVPITLLPGASEVCGTNPDPATPEFQVLDAPLPNTSVSSPVTVSGRVLAFEGTYQVAIYDVDGNAIVETFGTAAGEEIGQLADFSIDVAFEVSEQTAACIWVYEQSARDGSPIHVGQIPVVLLP